MFEGSLLAHTDLLGRATLRNRSQGKAGELHIRQTTEPGVGVPESSNVPRRESMERRSGCLTQ
jgi:hypothetical protein